MESSTLSQQVYEQLHLRLRRGDLSPGKRLVNRTLASEFGTSTIPVREAISRLVSEGLLDSSPGGGAFVRNPDADELGELYDVRESLEVLAATEAARFATEHTVAELRSIYDDLSEIARGIPADGHATPAAMDRWLDAEEQFHERVVAASRNRWLAKIVANVRVIAQVFAAQRLSPSLLTQDVAQTTLQQHGEFLEILANRDVARAGAWMSQHIRSGRQLVLEFIRKQGQGPK